jgi:DNA ligase-1
MKDFSRLLSALILTPSRNRKIDLMAEYFRKTPDPDRGLALAALTGALSFAHVKSASLRNIVTSHVDEILFALSYDYVGDLAETIALIWPLRKEGTLPSLSQIYDLLNETDKKDVPNVVADLLSRGASDDRWALIKLATGHLRIGVSARLAKTAIAQMSGKDIQEIEEIWHGLAPPYTDFFQWCEGGAARPEIVFSDVFHPLMLSNPIDEIKDLAVLDPEDFQAEWKWDGIRVQLVLHGERKVLYSRTGDMISGAFPDIIAAVHGEGVLDGELLTGHDLNAASFNNLQQRLNRKTVSASMLKEYPAFIRVYDILFDGEEDVRARPLLERRERLERWLLKYPQSRMDLSRPIHFSNFDELAAIRRAGAAHHGHEGVMLKRKDSSYVPGRPKGLWFKWKRDPNTIDAVMMYAQRGHGKRSSYYSDYTFGVWKDGQIVPIGKAYSGFTDEELKKLDRFVRGSTLNRFGPVREVEKTLVLEIAFDSAHESARHKSGVALRFPRVNRIRWDKPAAEANTLESLRAQFITS